MSAQAVTMPKAVRVIPAKPEYSGKSNSDFRPKRVAAYCRVSTDKEEQEHSFETQKEMYTDMIMMKPNWQMAGIYADEGITGTIAKENPWKPFVSVEIFEAMNSMNPTGTVGIERIRYEAGTNYAVNKLISLEMKLRAERLTIKKQLYSSVGIGVKFNL